MAIEETGYEKEELIDGEICMSPLADIRHSFVISRLHGMLFKQLSTSLCDVHTDNVYLHIDENNKFIPDLMITCDRKNFKKDGYHGVPKFIVEVTNNRSEKRDRVNKMKSYAKLGVIEYWLIDYKSCKIEVYVLSNGEYSLNEVYSFEPDKESEDYVSHMSVNLTSFPNITIDLEDLFDFYLD